MESSISSLTHICLYNEVGKKKLILQYYLEKLSVLNLINFDFFWEKSLLIFSPSLNWRKLAINQYNHFFSTSYLFDNFYRLIKMNNCTTLKKITICYIYSWITPPTPHLSFINNIVF
jgi:hypothetical protein